MPSPTSCDVCTFAIQANGGRILNEYVGRHIFVFICYEMVYNHPKFSVVGVIHDFRVEKKSVWGGNSDFCNFPCGTIMFRREIKSDVIAGPVGA